jgi:siroheme decarboxylase
MSAAVESVTDEERGVLLAIQDGLPLVPSPYAKVAERLGLREEEVIRILRGLLESRKVKRIGAVPNHYALGIAANGMSVWDIPDELADQVGAKLAERPEVSHCYKRPRAEDWPYNVFAMVHARDREKVRKVVEAIGRDLGISERPHDILFSTRLLKKRGTRIKSQRNGEKRVRSVSRSVPCG